MIEKTTDNEIEEVAEEKSELFGKVRADLRNEQLRRLIIDWEKERDELYDEIASRKGKVELLEALVKQSYEKILDVNKEEQAKEQEVIEARLSALRIAQEEADEKRVKEEAAALLKKEGIAKRGKKRPKKSPTATASELSKRKAEANKKKKGE
jgi:hypothetical protein